MSGEPVRGEPRNREIIRNAIEAFGRYGVRGASLRDIARKAGVSLTLIHHHFGNKPSLVWASTHSMLKAGAGPLARLREDMALHVSSARELVAAWTRYLVGAFGTDAGVDHLRLIQRLRVDPDVDPVTQASLDAAEPILREALCRLYPDATTGAIGVVLKSSRAALWTALFEEGAFAPARSEQPRLGNAACELAEAFVAAAIHATLGGAGDGDPSTRREDVGQFVLRVHGPTPLTD